MFFENYILGGSSMKTIRIIVPAFPEINIFTRQAKKTTALGPVMVATVANKLSGFRVEVIDENNYHGPRDENLMPEHLSLQIESPAVIVGFYCGLSSTMERVWQLAEFYKRQGVITIAGGWHAHYCPKETLEHNIDVVVHGDGEEIIEELISQLASNGSLEQIPGISFKRDDGTVRTNEPYMLENTDLDNLPYPDFGLLRFAKIKIYPIGRIRGCGMNCEFCSVKGKPRCASARHFFDLVNWLVETRNAKHFFIVDDRLEQDIEETIRFFRMVFQKYGRQLSFTVQMRLETAKNISLLEIMERAGVRHVCIGYESPIDEDLKTMRKGYSSLAMVDWTKTLRNYFWVHGMFIAGYPSKQGKSSLSPKEIVRRYKRFIRKAKIDSIQVLLPVPLVGTDLRKRIQDRIFSLELVPWSMYDGNYPCFKPENMSVEDLQWIGIKIMKGFYQKISLLKIGLRTIFFPIDFFIRGWNNWHRYWQRDIVNYSGHRLVRGWLNRNKKKEFIKKLQ